MKGGEGPEHEDQGEVVSDHQPQDGDDDCWDSRQRYGGELDG